MTEKAFREWAKIEIMGHQVYAGLVSEQSIAGAAFIRIDVPATSKIAPFTKFFGASSIYAIQPVDEQIATALAEQYANRPVNVYELGKVGEDIKREAEAQLQEQLERLKIRERELLALSQEGPDPKKDVPFMSDGYRYNE